MKAFFSTLLASLAIATPSMATPAPGGHQQLLDILAQDGIGVYVNSPAQACYGDRDVDGMYIANDGNRYLVVCQDNATTSETVSWTENDLDTIRHETFHIIQDCMAGSNNDMEFDTVFANQDKVIDALGVVESMRIMSAYSVSYDADRHDSIKYEVEAFYAARNYSASQITSIYTKYCR